MERELVNRGLTASYTDVVSEGLLECDVSGDVRHTQPQSVASEPDHRLHQQLAAQRSLRPLCALLELPAGDERPHDPEREVEAEGRQHGEVLHDVGLSLHPAPVAVQAETDTAGIDPGHEDGGEVTLRHLAGEVREQPVLQVPQGEGVQQQDVGDGDCPDQADNIINWDL